VDIDNMKTVIDAAMKGAEVQTLEQGTHQLVIHTGLRGTETLDLSGLHQNPFRKRGTVTVYDADSFNRLLGANAVDGHTTVYFNRDPEKPAIVAVFNGNGQKGPGFGDFRACIGFRPTPQWLKWKSIDGELLPQATFAEFIEDNIEDIASPSGAEMMEIATFFEATKTVDFRSSINLTNGTVQFRNNENMDAKVKAGEMAVPTSFVVGLAPVVGVAPFEITARLRHRVEHGKLKLGFKLQRIEEIMTTVLKEIEAGIDVPANANVTMVFGTAPS
jgi:uncharacterized protein YfdQ (DUF2303 family)